MNLGSIAQQVLRRSWRDLAPECCVCRRRVAEMEEPRNDMYSLVRPKREGRLE